MFLLYPLFLLLLLVPLYFFLRRFKTSSQGLERYISDTILQKLSLETSLITNRLRTNLFLLALSFFILALARPVNPKETLSLTQSKSSLVIAVDFSKSMHQKDIYPSRLALALKKLDILLQKAKQLDIGILFYAKDAYMLYPLSQNPKLLQSLLKDANITQSFSEHTNLFAPIEASQTLLKNHQNRHLLLLSDTGKEVDRKAELDYLRAHHTHLSILAITPADSLTMQKLSKQSGGIYMHYTWSDDDVDALLDFFLHAHTQTEAYRYNLAQYDELYIYPLLGGLLLLILLWLPRKPRLFVPLIVLSTLLLTPIPSHAGMFDVWQHYQKRKTYNLATKTYQQKHYIDAVTLYTQALGEDKLLNAKIYHNIATAYVHAHKLRLAKRYYEKSLQSFALPEAKDNLIMVTQLLKVERKNLHKKYQKLHFKAIAAKEQQYKTPFTNYAVKLHKLLPNEEERWFRKVLQHKSPLYLQKIPTHQRSLDANISW
jgi:Ca-activated chloride channel family protein